MAHIHKEEEFEDVFSSDEKLICPFCVKDLPLDIEPRPCRACTLPSVCPYQDLGCDEAFAAHEKDAHVSERCLYAKLSNVLHQHRQALLVVDQKYDDMKKEVGKFSAVAKEQQQQLDKDRLQCSVQMEMLQSSVADLTGQLLVDLQHVKSRVAGQVNILYAC
jgi:hypothetical protein